METSSPITLLASPSRRSMLLCKASIILFALLPFHVLVMYSLANKLGFEINDPVYILLKSWKEGLVFGALLIGGVVFRDRGKMIGLDWLVIGFTIFGILYVFFSERLLLAVWSFRALFSIFLFYAFGRMQRYEVDDFYSLMKMLFKIGLITAVFGIAQVEWLGPDFHFEAYGDDAPASVFTADYDKMRATSTFISVHEFGLFLVILLFAVLFLTSKKYAPALWQKGAYVLGSLVLLAGVAYSFSRSSIIILGVGILFLAVRKARFIPIAIILLFSFYLLLGFLDMYSNLELMSEGRDSSTSGHMDVVGEALGKVTKSPFGVGLGEVGVIARRFNPDAMQYEGEWFNIIVQMGIPGGACMVLMYVIIFASGYQVYKSDLPDEVRNLAMLVMLVVMGLSVREMILPRDQMNSSLGWFIIGAFQSMKQYILPSTKTIDEKLVASEVS